MSTVEAGPIETYRASSAADVVEILRDALSREIDLELIAGASKRALGRPTTTPHILDVSSLSGITAYEPEELVLTARAATPIGEITALLARNGQMLAFEPPDYSRLFGEGAGSATLGGIVATNTSGPRRLKAGAARDHVLGMRAVSGRAESFVAGGRVVKNVTGYDIPKLMTGSFGTLGVLTEVTVKVMPAPETQATLVWNGLDDETALRLMTAALQAPAEISAAAHQIGGNTATTALRLEGFAPSVADRIAHLSARAAEYGPPRVLDVDESMGLWRDVSDARALDAHSILWRISSPPSASAHLVARIRMTVPSSRALYDWGGALVWLALPGPDAKSDLVRSAASAAGGQAMLFKAPHETRSAIEVFPPLARPLADLTLRIKEQFDPRRVLNRGRMYAWA